KTHVIESLRSVDSLAHLSLARWPDESEPLDRPFVRVITDTTEIDPQVRHSMFANRPASCQSVVAAVNAGPLLQLARQHPGAQFERVRDILPRAQQGVLDDHVPDVPVVLDVGGYDPVQNDVVAELLARPLLKEIVFATRCGCEDPKVCPRRLAWDQLA